jgi:hypothetical protein
MAPEIDVPPPKIWRGVVSIRTPSLQLEARTVDAARGVDCQDEMQVDRDLGARGQREGDEEKCERED